MTGLAIRPATAADAGAVHALISAHTQEGRLLPRDLPEIARHVSRFAVCEVGGVVKACAELAPLSPRLAEVRSLVVAKDVRRAGLAARLVGELRDRARAAGFESLCAFTHEAQFFVRQNFSIVPHVWLPEKVTTNCLSCALYGTCGQHAMLLPLLEMPHYAATPSPARRVAVA